MERLSGVRPMKGPAADDVFGLRWMFGRFADVVAIKREGHRLQRSGPSVRYQRWDRDTRLPSARLVELEKRLKCFCGGEPDDQCQIPTGKIGREPKSRALPLER